MNEELLQELDTAVDDIANDDEIQVLIITGAGNKAFVAGADIKQMQPFNVVRGRSFGRLGQEVF